MWVQPLWMHKCNNRSSFMPSPSRRKWMSDHSAETPACVCHGAVGASMCACEPVGVFRREVGELGVPLISLQMLLPSIWYIQFRLTTHFSGTHVASVVIFNVWRTWLAHMLFPENDTFQHGIALETAEGKQLLSTLSGIYLLLHHLIMHWSEHEP